VFLSSDGSIINRNVLYHFVQIGDMQSELIIISARINTMFSFYIFFDFFATLNVKTNVLFLFLLF